VNRELIGFRWYFALGSFETGDMEALPKIVRQRLRPETRPGVHPHADLLTAFAEKTLTERERTRVVEHLSRCEDCREVVFLSAPQQEPVQIVGRIPSRGGWLSWPALRWGAAAACVIVVGTAVTLLREDSRHPALMERAASKSARPVDQHPESATLAATAPNQAVVAESRRAPTQTRKDTGEEKLMAKAVPARPSPKAMIATPRMPMQFDQSREINGNNIEATRSLSGADASNMAAAPTSARVSKDENLADQPERNKKQVQAPTGSMNEMVQVQASSVEAPVEPESAPEAKSKGKESLATDLKPNGYSVSSAKANEPTGGSLQRGLADSAKMKKMEADSGSATLVQRWRLTSGGTLQRSLDAGDNWENVTVPAKIPLQAFAALLAEVWVGGASGHLYHSSDAGLHWAQVIPNSNNESLTGGITHIEFTDVQNGKVTTTSGEAWITADGGENWRKN
jgi:hypothetical protein